MLDLNFTISKRSHQLVRRVGSLHCTQCLNPCRALPLWWDLAGPALVEKGTVLVDEEEMNDDVAAAAVVVGSALSTVVVADVLVVKVVGVPTEDVADEAADAADSMGGMTILAIVQV